jgi:hypothetical protein
VRLRLSLVRGGRVLARLGPVARTLLPHSRGIERFRYPGRLRGWVTARVEWGRFGEPSGFGSDANMRQRERPQLAGPLSLCA